MNRVCGDSAPKSTETYTNRNASNIDAKAVQKMSSKMGNIVSVDDPQPSTDHTMLKHEELLRKDLEV